MSLTVFDLSGQKEKLIKDAQDLALAEKYFTEQEYEKVLDRLEDLGSRSTDVKVYNLLSQSYLELEEYRKAIRLSRNWARRVPARRAVFEVDEYSLHKRQEDEKDAASLMQDILQVIQRSPGQSYAYGKAFGDKGFTQEALRIYQSALESNPNMNFDYQMALLYGELGDIPQMHQMYLQMVERTPGYLETVKMLLTQSISPGLRDENIELLKQSIIKRIQSGAPKRFNDLLIHIYSQEENFRAAFTQLRSLDRQKVLEGKEIFNLGRLAFNNEDYSLAQRIFAYEMEKGPGYSYYQTAVISWLDARTLDLKSKPKNLEAWQELAEDYQKHVQEFRGDPYQADLAIPYAEILAYQLYKTDSAESILLSLFDHAWIGPDDQALGQIAYADLLLFTGRRWDAIIYYRKAEKALDQSVIGQEAKFKRAKAAYYVGDFEWAQGIFGVLKQSTSKLIANDAMQYSLLITDNMALDSTTEALAAYAKADLYFFREIYDSATAILEVLELAYSDHPIADESLMMRANIQAAQGNLEQAVSLWLRVAKEHEKDILADDAWYKIAQAEESRGNTEKAMAAYEKIFTVYLDSFYSSEARKAYRRLRGDQLN